MEDLQPQERPLHGRADVMVEYIRRGTLIAKRAEPPLNHVHVTGWPQSKEERMSIAQEIVKHAVFKRLPPGH